MILWILKGLIVHGSVILWMSLVVSWWISNLVIACSVRSFLDTKNVEDNTVCCRRSKFNLILADLRFRWGGSKSGILLDELVDLRDATGLGMGKIPLLRRWLSMTLHKVEVKIGIHIICDSESKSSDSRCDVTFSICWQMLQRGIQSTFVVLLRFESSQNVFSSPKIRSPLWIQKPTFARIPIIHSSLPFLSSWHIGVIDYW